MKVALVILTVLILTGCSTLTGVATDAALGAVGLGDDKGLSVDTEIVAGDKSGIKTGVDTKLEDVEVNDNGQIHNTTTGELTDITGAESVTLNEGVPFWQAGVGILLGIFLGLFMPQFAIRRK